MVKRGEVYLNPITGERAVIRIGTDETNGERLLVDLYIRPGGAVAARHLHPALHERFTVISGRIGFFLDGEISTVEPGQIVDVQAGSVHDFWNAGDDVAHSMVEIQPAARFEAFICNGFGLALDGKTNAKGMPNLLQLSLLAREFDDVIQFVNPPWFAQRVLFSALAPIARLMGYKGTYDRYLNAGPSATVSVDASPYASPDQPLSETEVNLVTA